MREDKDIERLRRTTQQFAGTIGRYFELERWDNAALFAGMVGMVVSVVWWIG